MGFTHLPATQPRLRHSRRISQNSEPVRNLSAKPPRQASLTVENPRLTGQPSFCSRSCHWPKAGVLPHQIQSQVVQRTHFTPSSHQPGRTPHLYQPQAQDTRLAVENKDRVAPYLSHLQLCSLDTGRRAATYVPAFGLCPPEAVSGQRQLKTRTMRCKSCHCVRHPSCISCRPG